MLLHLEYITLIDLVWFFGV